MKIDQATKEDLAEILRLQKVAYQSEAKIYNDFSIPPLTQTFDEIQQDFSFQIFLKIVVKNHIIGSVRAYKENETCFIGKLIIDPDFQNQGIGTNLLRNLIKELTLNNIKQVILEVRKNNKKAIRFYQKHGFEITDTISKFYKNEENAYVMSTNI